MINNAWLAGFLTLIICLSWMQLNNLFAKKNWVSSSISRKIIHIGTGPVFLLCWILFPDKSISKYLAAIVPFLILLQILFINLGILKDNSTVKAMARTGNKNELLKGPFFYGVIFVILTLIYWKTAIAVIPLMVLCGGDGMADLIGSRFGLTSLPWNKKKTVLGSFSMFLGGFLLSIIMLTIFYSAGIIKTPIVVLLLPVGLISLVATLIESVTPSEFDNISVPAAALALSLLLL